MAVINFGNWKHVLQSGDYVPDMSLTGEPLIMQAMTFGLFCFKNHKNLYNLLGVTKLAHKNIICPIIQVWADYDPLFSPFNFDHLISVQVKFEQGRTIIHLLNQFILIHPKSAYSSVCHPKLMMKSAIFPIRHCYLLPISLILLLHFYFSSS